MAAEAPPSSRTGGDDAVRADVRIMLLIGPHARPSGSSLASATGPTALPALRATVETVHSVDEAGTAAAFAGPYDAVVLDPGVLEHVSRSTAEAVRRSPLPVVVAGSSAEDGSSAMVSRRVVTPVATASVQGGGGAAYDGAVEAAAWLAWSARDERRG